MAGIRVHRSKAARYTRMAQAAALVLLVGAVGAFALLPVAGRVEALPVHGGGDEPTEPTAAGPGIDFQVTAERMALLGDVKKAPPPATEDPKGGGGDPEGEGTPTGPEWKYLGAIVEPDRLVAIVDVEGGQHLVTNGASLNGTEVLEVRADAIVVAGATGKRTIELRKRMGAVIGGVGATSVGIEHIDEADHENEAEVGMDPRPMDRRGPAGGKRPTGPGTKNIPRTPRPNPPGNSNRGRPGTPEGT